MHGMFESASTVNAPGSNFNQVTGVQNNFFGTSNSNTVFDALDNASIPEAHYNSTTRETPSCHPGTRIDILSRLSEWSSAAEVPPICQLLGDAGYGKTAIAQSLAHLCAARPFDSPHSLAATFFFNRDHIRRRAIQYVIPTLMKQLSSTVPEISPVLQSIIQQTPSFFTSVFDDQVQVLLTALRSLSSSQMPRVVIFDGLDECDDPNAILRLVSSLVDPISIPHFRLRVFVASRPPVIWGKSRPVISLIYSLNLRDFSTDHDIRVFLAHRLQEIRGSRPSVMVDMPLLWPSESELDALVAEASGMFIFAATAATFIGDKRYVPQEQLTIVLRMHTSHDESQWGNIALDRLYKQVLSSCHDRAELLLVLSALAFLQTPLNPRQLGYLLGLPLGHVQLALEGLHSILFVPDDPDQGLVSPLHISLIDFLTSATRAGEYFIDSQNAHTTLSRACLALVRQALPRYQPIFRTPKYSCPRVVVQKIEMLMLSDNAQAEATRYACKHLTYHLEHSMARNHHLQSDLSRFCRDQVIPWKMYLAKDTRSMTFKKTEVTFFISTFLSLKPFLGPLFLVTWIIASIGFRFLHLDPRDQLMIFKVAITLSSLFLFMFLSSVWWVTLLVGFLALRLRSAWRPVFVTLAASSFFTVALVRIPTPTPFLEIQVPWILVFFSFVVEDPRTYWVQGTTGAAMCRLSTALLAATTASPRASRFLDIAAISVCALSLGLCFPWARVSKSRFWPFGVGTCWVLIYLALRSFLGISGSLLTAAVVALRSRQVLRLLRPRQARDHIKWSRMFPTNWMRGAALTHLCDPWYNHAVALFEVDSLAYLWGLFAAGFLVNGMASDVTLVATCEGLLRQAVTCLARISVLAVIIFYLERYRAFWVKHFRSMNKMDLTSRFMYIVQMRYWGLNIKENRTRGFSTFSMADGGILSYL